LKTFQSGKRAGGRWSVHEKRYLLRGVGRVHRQPIDIAVATVSLQLKAPSKGSDLAAKRTAAFLKSILILLMHLVPKEMDPDTG
jgi:hypothetical protein